MHLHPSINKLYLAGDINSRNLLAYFKVCVMSIARMFSTCHAYTYRLSSLMTFPALFVYARYGYTALLLKVVLKLGYNICRHTN